MNAILNHLWQSTLFAGAAAMAAVALRKNSPRARYWLWLAASVKFLIPFSLLVWTGSRIELPPTAPSLHATTVEEISAYFAPVLMQPPATPMQAAFLWPNVLAAMWLFGASFLMIRWLRSWRAIRKSASRGTKLPLRFPVPVLSSPSAIEPGVFGIFRPVLLLPQGLADHLTPEQLDAVLVHECRHILCRDNLSAAVHMCVETLFWFHPLVWWIGAKLTDERESDCDEAVLREGSQPRDYAQGIVNVCRTYVESPLSCAAGISGSDLKKRIRDIMMWRAPLPVTIRGRVMLSLAALALFSIPVGIGIVRAQSLPADPKYGYEVASIHRSAPGKAGEQFSPGPRGGIRTRNTSVLILLQWAFELSDYRFVDAPGWLSSERYDIVLTPDTPGLAPRPDTPTKDALAGYHRNQQRLRPYCGIVSDSSCALRPAKCPSTLSYRRRAEPSCPR
jgi:bla regulator protein blaR1